MATFFFSLVFGLVGSSNRLGSSMFLTEESGATSGQSGSSWYPVALVFNMCESVPSWNCSRSEKKPKHFDIYNEIHEYPIRYERKPKAKIKGVY